MSSGRSSFSTNLVSSITPSFSIAIADEVMEGCDQCRARFRNVLDERFTGTPRAIAKKLRE
jgi:hypothetical protein